MDESTEILGFAKVQFHFRIRIRSLGTIAFLLADTMPKITIIEARNNANARARSQGRSARCPQRDREREGEYYIESLLILEDFGVI